MISDNGNGDGDGNDKNNNFNYYFKIKKKLKNKPHVSKCFWCKPSLGAIIILLLQTVT